MASRVVLLALAIAAVVVAPPVLATDFVVGDGNGWKNNNFDYKAWAQSKEFHVGDKLIFKYRPGAHNVYKVDQSGFQQCTTLENGTSMNSGNDEITLSSPGKKWYICGIGSHCESGGMKLAINVLSGQGAAPTLAPAPVPSTPAPPFTPAPSAAPHVAPPRFAAWMVAPIFFIVLTIMA